MWIGDGQISLKGRVKLQRGYGTSADGGDLPDHKYQPSQGEQQVSKVADSM